MLRRAQPLVRAHCASLGMPYTERRLLETFVFVVRHLDRVGIGQRGAAACPVSQQFRSAR